MAQPNMLQITISITAPEHPGLDDSVLPLEVKSDSKVKDLKNLVSSGTGFNPETLRFYLNGVALNAEEISVQDAGIKDGEMLALFVQKAGAAQGQQVQRGGRAATGAATQRRQAGPTTSEQIETTRLQILGDQHGLNELREKVPALANAVNDPTRFREVWLAMKREESDRERERQEQIELFNRDPFNVEAQRKIEEMIRQDRVMENLQDAYENNPEVFGRVSMLYINAEVEGTPIKAFVDSGAQVTIMSPSCAEKCNIMRLLDTRYGGIARGVGTAKILGRIHKAKIVIGGAEMYCSFTVMEGKDVDLLFGLDMLKRHRACIDLESNTLKFQGVSVPFLGEAEIPKDHEEAALHEPTIPGPNGTEIGGVSGAVQPAGTAAKAAASGSSQAGPSNTTGNFQGQGQAVGSAQPRAQQQPQAQPQTGAFPQADIDQLVSLGFSRQAAEEALRATGGNVEYAAGLLFSG